MADFNLEQAYKALEAADAAGAEDDARQIADMIKQFQGSEQPQTAVEEAPQQPQKEESFLGKIDQALLGGAQGLIADPLIGLGQLGARGLDLLIPGDALTKGVDKLATAQEDWYQKTRKDLGGQGFDVSRLVGNVAPAVGSLGTSLIGSGARAAGKIASKLPKKTPPRTPQLARAEEILRKQSLPYQAIDAVSSGAKQVASKLPTNALDKYGQAVFTPITAVGKGLEKLGLKGARKFTGGDLDPRSLSRGLLYGAQAPLSIRENDPNLQEDYLSRKLGQVGLSAGLGGVLTPLARYSRAVSPDTEFGKLLAKQKLGTSGQRTGNESFENVYASAAPFIGKKIFDTKERALKEIKPIIDKAYDDIWSNARITSSKPFENVSLELKNQIKNLKANRTGVSQDKIKILSDADKVIKNNFIDEFIGLTKSQQAAKNTVASLEKLGMKVTDPKILKEAAATGKLPRNLQGRDIDKALKEIDKLKENAFEKLKDVELGNYLKGIKSQLDDLVSTQQKNPIDFSNKLQKARKIYSGFADAEKSVSGSRSPLGTAYSLLSGGAGIGGLFYNPALGVSGLAAGLIPGLAALSPNAARVLGGTSNVIPRITSASVQGQKEGGRIGGLDHVPKYFLGGIVKGLLGLGKRKLERQIEPHSADDELLDVSKYRVADSNVRPSMDDFQEFQYRPEIDKIIKDQAKADARELRKRDPFGLRGKPKPNPKPEPEPDDFGLRGKNNPEPDDFDDFDDFDDYQVDDVTPSAAPKKKGSLVNLGVTGLLGFYGYQALKDKSLSDQLSTAEYNQWLDHKDSYSGSFDSIADQVRRDTYLNQKEWERRQREDDWGYANGGLAHVPKYGK